MKNVKSEKGAITILVLISVLSFVAFLISSYVIVSNKAKSQKEIVEQTKEIYSTKESMEEIYNSYFANSEIIPIYTVEQFLKIGNNQDVVINEENSKIYNFSDDGVYVLMNDLVLEKEWYSNELNGKIKAFELNGHKIIADGIEYPYTWIEDNLKQREIIGKQDKLSEDILIKIANAMHDSQMPIETFTVGKEIVTATSYDYVMYLYGQVYKNTYVRDENGIGDGVASYNARAEKIALLNSLCDRNA